MGKGTEAARLDVISVFPGLSSDDHFDVTSPEDPSYNCIAWAYQIKGRWMWPPAGIPVSLDAVSYWPDENASTDVERFVEAVSMKGYEKCEDASFEDGYRKIALYVKPGTQECTHAARQLSSGFWTSKLGQWYDIQHSTPKEIEGRCYGVVYCYMKREFR